MSVRKLTCTLFVVNGLQLMLGAGLVIGLQADLIAYSEILVDLSLGLVLLSSLLAIAGLLSMSRYEKLSYAESIQNLEDLNVKLREQRHDYLNQIQIVNGLLQLGEYEEAREYLRPVFKDIMKVNRALRTAQPAVNALLWAKLEAAGEQGIDFYPEIGTQLAGLPIEPWEFCKILSNLIDNAMTALGERSGEKWIRLIMQETPSEYRIRVCNNGPEITSEQRKHIFNRGYTTKKGEGHGMGLAIVASILRDAGGAISVESSPEETDFSFTLPRRNPKSFSLSRGEKGLKAPLRRNGDSLALPRGEKGLTTPLRRSPDSLTMPHGERVNSESESDRLRGKLYK